MNLEHSVFPAPLSPLSANRVQGPKTEVGMREEMGGEEDKGKDVRPNYNHLISCGACLQATIPHIVVCLVSQLEDMGGQGIGKPFPSVLFHEWPVINS